MITHKVLVRFQPYPDAAPVENALGAWQDFNSANQQAIEIVARSVSMSKDVKIVDVFSSESVVIYRVTIKRDKLAKHMIRHDERSVEIILPERAHACVDGSQRCQ